MRKIKKERENGIIRKGIMGKICGNAYQDPSEVRCWFLCKELIRMLQLTRLLVLDRLWLVLLIILTISVCLLAIVTCIVILVPGVSH